MGLEGTVGVMRDLEGSVLAWIGLERSELVQRGLIGSRGA